ncbi:poly polymerase [Xylariales sp. AK1849]|nr:poly polymerase [Xylariales sp. AK1849]
MPPKKKQDNPAPPTRATRSRKQAAASEDNKPDAQPQNDPEPPKSTRGRKRAVTSTVSDADSQPSQPQKKAKSSASQVEDKVKPQAIKKPKATQSEADSKASPQLQTPSELENAQIAKAGIKIPVDESCPLTQYEVYIDDDGVIYDAALNQTNAGNNNNKFYRVQLLRNISGDYKTWTRWGRVGDRGQSAVLGSGLLGDALSHFNKKFKDKSGLSWEDRTAPPKAKKYTFVERSYAPDSDDEDEDTKNIKTEDDAPSPESKLAQPVQELIELIFNQEYFANTMSELNYDVKKLPLGKLSKNTITRGFQALKDLSALLNDPSLAETEHGTSYQQATEDLSNAYFSLIPHAFGRNKPPVIRDQTLLKREIELLESLGDMKDAAAILKGGLKDEEKINALDRQFQGLGLEEMTPLKSSSAEFLELKNYLVDTRGSTHNANYQVDQIFRLERHGEKDRFDSSPFAGPPQDRRLLWHGSRCTNFGGILSQGLRIAPPEAPVSGYMFGKGIYLADMSSKSANYCCPYSSNGHALLLLCEAELGDPMQVLTNASYNAGDDAKAKGMLSTWGQGMTGPSLWKDAECVHPSLKDIKMPDTTSKPGPTGAQTAYLQYNEYIAYNVAQIRLRYLFRVRM